MKIGNEAFYCEQYLASLNIPASVTEIGTSAFSNCTGLQCITSEAENPPTANEYLLSGISNIAEIPFNVPEGSVSAYQGATGWSKLTNINSFAGGSWGEEPQEVTWTYNSCSGKLKIIGSGEMPSYWSEDEIPWKNKKSEITSVIIGNGITNIADYSFKGCPNLASVTFEETSQVASIGYEAFADCPSLPSITLPASLTNLDANAFADDDNLAEINFKSTVPPFTSKLNLSRYMLDRITYPDGADEAYVNNCMLEGGSLDAARWWNNLYNESGTHAPMPHAEGTTGDVNWEFSMAVKPGGYSYNFEDLRGMVTISGSGAMADYDYPFNVLPRIYHENTHTITIESGVTTIGEYAFNNLYQVATVNIPASVTNIKANAFYGCGGTVDGVSIYCQANPASLTWTDEGCNDFINVSSYSDDEKLMAMAHCYVPASYVSGYTSKWNTGNASNDVNAVFVAAGLSDVNDAAGINAILTELNNQVLESATITRPAPRDGYFFTLCVPFDIPAMDIATSSLSTAEIMVFADARVVGGELYADFDVLRAGMDGIDAGKPYFVRYPDPKTRLEKLDFTNVTVKNLDPGDYSVTHNNVTMIGTFVPKYVEGQSASDPHDLLFLGAENKLYWPNTGGTIKPFRCYFEVNTSGGGSLAPRRGMPAHIVVRDNSTTGIDNLQGAEVFEGKLLENGQLVIFRKGMKYNAAGQIVK